MIKFRNLPDRDLDDRCIKCDHECNEDCGDEHTPNLCKILGVRLEEEFMLNKSTIHNPCKVVMRDGLHVIENSYGNVVLLDMQFMYKVIDSPRMYIKEWYSKELREVFKALNVLGIKYAVRNVSVHGIKFDILFSFNKPFSITKNSSWEVKGGFMNIKETEIDPDLFNFITGDEKEPFEIPYIEVSDD